MVQTYGSTTGPVDPRMVGAWGDPRMAQVRSGTPQNPVTGSRPDPVTGRAGVPQYDYNTASRGFTIGGNPRQVQAPQGAPQGFQSSLDPRLYQSFAKNAMIKDLFGGHANWQAQGSPDLGDGWQQYMGVGRAYAGDPNMDFDRLRQQGDLRNLPSRQEMLSNLGIGGNSQAQTNPAAPDPMQGGFGANTSPFQPPSQQNYQPGNPSWLYNNIYANPGVLGLGGKGGQMGGGNSTWQGMPQNQFGSRGDERAKIGDQTLPYENPKTSFGNPGFGADPSRLANPNAASLSQFSGGKGGGKGGSTQPVKRGGYV